MKGMIVLSKKRLALTQDGRLTNCVAPEGKVGVGRCNHIAHQEPNESIEEFIARIDNQMMTEGIDNSIENIDTNNISEIDQKDIDEYAAKIDAIAGCKVTPENLSEVLSTLTPEQIRQITEIGFQAAPEFSLPISDDEYGKQDLENKLYFTSLPEHGVAGKSTIIEQMFNSIGTVPSMDGEIDIKSNFKEGLTDDEYFDKLFSARASMIAKTVSVSKPGYISRKLFYALSDIHIKEDCGNNKSTGILDCSVPGGLCSKCAAISGLKLKPGTLFGANVSTNLSEPLTQLSMREFHSIYHDQTLFVKRV